MLMHRAEAAFQDADSMAVARSNTKGAEIWQHAALAVDIGWSDDTLAQADGCAGIVVTRQDDRLALFRQPGAGQAIRLALDRHRVATADRIFTQQSSHFGFVGQCRNVE